MLIITGTIAFDYIMDFPGSFSDHIMSEHIKNVNLSFIVNKFAKRRGGTAGNVSYNLGLLHTPHILFSTAGKDIEEYKSHFLKMGIDFSWVETQKNNYTATGFAMTDKTNNQIWGYFYGAAEAIGELKLEKVAGKKDLVLIGPSGARGSLSLIRQCVKLGISYMFDPGFILTQVSNEDLGYGIKHAKYIIGNDYEIKLIKDRISDWQKIFYHKIVITTLGDKGSKIINNNMSYNISSVQPAKIVDPTGAGDAWRSGFLTGVDNGFDLVTCAQLGSVAASFVLEEYGTQEHYYSKEKFLQRYFQSYGKLIKL